MYVPILCKLLHVFCDHVIFQKDDENVFQKKEDLLFNQLYSKSGAQCVESDNE